MLSLNNLNCKLSVDEKRARLAHIQSIILEKILTVESTENGLLLGFEYSSQLCEQIDFFISLENSCCSFLTFTVSSSDSELSLLIEGPASAEQVLTQFHQSIEGKLL